MDGTTVNLIATAFSLITFIFLAIWVAYPKLKTKSKPSLFIPLIGVHLFRNVGMMALAPGMSSPEVPLSVYQQMAFGDLITAVLALITIIIIHSQKVMSSIVVLSVWIFNLFGFLDALHAMKLAMENELANLPMGPMWYVGVFYVPLLIVSHMMIFYFLLKRK